MKTVILVSNIKCENCAKTIQKALRKFIGVEDVVIDLKKGQIAIEHTEEVSREKMTEKLLSLGYSERGRNL